MIRYLRSLSLCGMLVAALLMAHNADAAEAKKQQGPPPAAVVVAKVESGKASPEGRFVGSIEFPEVSSVAAEVSGRVDKVAFEEGDRVKSGQVLVQLDNDLLVKDLESAQAQYAQALADLENAKLEQQRISKLFKSRSVSEKEYDNARLTRIGLEKKAYSLKASAERLRIQIAKSRIRAPFDGIVLEKQASRGEWVGAGTVIGSIARNDFVQARVEVPQAVLPFVSKGRTVQVDAGGVSQQGTVIAVIPKGDVVTRTFPVKVRLKSKKGLAQGMEAKVSLPSGAEMDALLVPRDAVIRMFGQTVVWTVADGKATSVPVFVEAWQGLKAAVRGEGLKAGTVVVTKGNERLRPGQPVFIKK